MDGWQKLPHEQKRTKPLQSIGMPLYIIFRKNKNTRGLSNT